MLQFTYYQRETEANKQKGRDIQRDRFVWRHLTNVLTTTDTDTTQSLVVMGTLRKCQRARGHVSPRSCQGCHVVSPRHTSSPAVSTESHLSSQDSTEHGTSLPVQQRPHKPPGGRAEHEFGEKCSATVDGRPKEKDEGSHFFGPADFDTLTSDNDQLHARLGLSCRVCLVTLVRCR